MGCRVCSPPVDLWEQEGEEDKRKAEPEERARERKCGMHRLEKVEVE